jgi:hypothetical protein
VNAITVKSPADLQQFLAVHIDPDRAFWLVTMRVPHCVVESRSDSMRQANAVNCEILQPAMLAHSICTLTKWMIERPHLSNKVEGYFAVQRTLSRPTVSFFMDNKDRLLDKDFPDPRLFKTLLEKLRKEGVTIVVEARNKGWLQ